MKKEQCKEHPSPDSPWLTLHPFVTCSPVQVGVCAQPEGETHK